MHPDFDSDRKTKTGTLHEDLREILGTKWLRGESPVSRATTRENTN